jgi:hypothetical protein
VNPLKGLQEADCVKAAKDLGLEAQTA